MSKKIEKIQAICKHEKKEIRVFPGNKKFQVCLNCGKKEPIVETPVKQKKEKTVEAKTPKKNSMLATALEVIPKGEELEMDSIVKLIQEAGQSAKAISSIKTVVLQLCHGAKSSPHINKYHCINEIKSADGKKTYRRNE